MKLTAKLFSVFILILLITLPLFINSCGGGSTGPCEESALPAGWTIEPESQSLEAPSSAGASCYPAVFTVYDDTGAPVSGMCVRLYTDGASTIAKETPDTPLCTASPVYNQLTTRTDDHGNIALQLVVPSCTSGVTYFVAATSGNISGKYTAACP